jgi:hypothetical protein
VLKIVTAADFPDAPASAFASLPRTLYRLGERYARLEEALDKERNLHLLVVVNEPDVWMVNLADRTGRHAVDDGPPKFHAPIVDNFASKFWRQFEFGCEEPFMKRSAPARRRRPRAGRNTRIRRKERR